jgi:hypothetical protein
MSTAPARDVETKGEARKVIAEAAPREKGPHD